MRGRAAVVAALVVGLSAWAGAQDGPPAPAPERAAQPDGTSQPDTLAQPGVDSAPGRAGPREIEIPSYGDKLVQMLWILAGIVLVFIASARLLPWLLGRVTGAGPASLLPGAQGRRIQVIERIRLDARKHLYLVKVGGRYLLLGATDQRIDVLGDKDLDQEALRALDQAAGGSGDGSRRSFAADLLRRARKEPRPGGGE